MKIDYLAINEMLDKYIEAIEPTFYFKKLFFFYQQSLDIAKRCSLFPKVQKFPKEPIDLLTGIELVEEYLEQIKPELVTDFKEKLANGVINFNFNDEASLEDAVSEPRYKDSGCVLYSYSVVDNEKETSARMQPSIEPRIEIDYQEDHYDGMVALVHEYFHSVSNSVTIDQIKDPENNQYILTLENAFREFFPIYFEFDFIHFCEQKGIEKDNFALSLYKRYNNTVLLSNILLEDTVFLLKKKKEGVLDEDSYKLGVVTTPEENYQRILTRYQTLIENQENDITKYYCPEEMSHYIIGATLGYYLSCQPDPLLPEKVLSMKETMNQLPLSSSLEKVGLSWSQVANLPFGSILDNMNDEVYDYFTNTETLKETRSSQKRF